MKRPAVQTHSTQKTLPQATGIKRRFSIMLSVAFTLPTSAPARLELVDVSGRRVAQREVGTLGAGRHALALAADRDVAPGLYLLRLTQGASVRVSRVTLLR